MNIKDLKQGCVYYYTAGAEWVRVTFKHETINGYLFTDGDTENILNAQLVGHYIEEV